YPEKAQDPIPNANCAPDLLGLGIWLFSGVWVLGFGAFAICNRVGKESHNNYSLQSHSSHFFGSFCFSLSTGSNKSPIFSTRPNVRSQWNTHLFASFFFNVSLTYS